MGGYSVPEYAESFLPASFFPILIFPERGTLSHSRLVGFDTASTEIDARKTAQNEPVPSCGHVTAPAKWTKLSDHD